MPVESPLKIGDVPYPQYSRVSKNFIKISVAVTKGNIFTLDAAGRLIAPVTTSSVADLTKGARQAMATVAAPAAEDTDDVQVLAAGSRIIMKADASLVPGQEVELKAVTSTTTPDKVMAGVAPRSKGFLGRIFEIYTKGTDGAVKQVTADGDLVIVELEV
jgi:hypothetical protein